jgi:hypothetical protein
MIDLKKIVRVDSDIGVPSLVLERMSEIVKIVDTPDRPQPEAVYGVLDKEASVEAVNEMPAVKAEVLRYE